MQQEQSVVAQWNELTLEAVSAGTAKPTITSYQLYTTHAAIYDAWAAYDAHASGLYSDLSRPRSEQTEANKEAAVSYAAYRMLVEHFPEQQARFADFMKSLGLEPTLRTLNPHTAAGVGNRAAGQVIAAREDDGAHRRDAYTDPVGYTYTNSADPASPSAPGGPDFDPNHWQPLRVPTGAYTDAEGYPIVTDDPASWVDQTPLSRHWGTVKPFALSSGDQLRPQAPPKLGDFSRYVDATGAVTTGDAAYRAQAADVLALSAGLTPERKVIAEFWADGPRTESPPGHWNQIAQGIAARQGHGVDDDARMFFAVNAAIFDASIATWDAKYAYDFIRPASAIRNLYFDQDVEAWGGPNQGTQTILGQQWRPYQALGFVTPPFPEFTSGHSAFSAAAAKTIAAYVGSDVYYDGHTREIYDLDDVPGRDLLGQYVATSLGFEELTGPPVVLQWATLSEAADEAGISRRYGGIHFQDGDFFGRELGRDVAGLAQQRWQAMFSNGGDDFIRADAAGGLILAGAGDDRVTGGTGDDIVEAGFGDDIVLGNRGADTILGEAGHDTLAGGVGGDRVSGGLGRDIVLGGRGDDELFGDRGPDRVEGGPGRDLVAGGHGRDVLGGGPGADAFVFQAGERGWDVVRDFNTDRDDLVVVGFGKARDVDFTLVRHAHDVTLWVEGERIADIAHAKVADIALGHNLHFAETFDHLG